MNQLVVEQSEVVPPDFDQVFARSSGEYGDRPRHIFIFLDGTWNEERTSRGQQTAPTNVLRMFQEINRRTAQELTSSPDSDKIHEIIAHYYRGVGSRQDNNTANRLWYGFNGKDEERIRAAAFADVYKTYRNENDRIYILGFSRGAASARLLARDICTKGLPLRLKVYTKHFANLMTGQIEARVESVEPLDKRDPEVETVPQVAFLGCWDTVDAFVLPSRFPRKKIIDKAARVLKSSIPRLTGKERFRGDENKIPDKVQKAVHCVAIDETRNAFLPTLMPRASNVEEVWFPGVHSDIGGGYDENMLAEGPYNFMKKRLIDAAGIDENVLFDTTARLTSGFCFHFHGLDSGMTQISKALFGFGTAMRTIRVLEGKGGMKPKIHGSIYRVMNSGSVFAADNQNKRTWTITYDPYNVRELKQEYEIIYDNEE